MTVPFHVKRVPTRLDTGDVATPGGPVAPPGVSRETDRPGDRCCARARNRGTGLLPGQQRRLSWAATGLERSVDQASAVFHVKRRRAGMNTPAFHVKRGEALGPKPDMARGAGADRPRPPRLADGRDGRVGDVRGWRMAEKRRALGRGLGALIPSAPSGGAGRPVDVFFTEQKQAEPVAADSADSAVRDEPASPTSSAPASDGSTPPRPHPTALTRRSPRAAGWRWSRR